jgi:aspartate/methionine/tyrosine aminotransferase
MANHLVMAALVESGDEVLIERPTYEPLLALAEHLGANVHRFDRRADESFALDPAEVTRALTSRTKLIVVTNLHNPSGSRAAESTLREIGMIAQEVGATVLVDEVYLDTAFEMAPRSAFHLNEAFVVTSSLTKAYGLGGLRCGWLLARPDLAEKIWALNDLFGVVGVHVAEQLGVMCFEKLDYLASRTRQLLMTNWSAYENFVENASQLDVKEFRWRTTSFPRLKSGSVEQLCDILVNKFETSVVPGRLFEAPQHFRIGFGGDPVTFADGLERLAEALKLIAA